MASPSQPTIAIAAPFAKSSSDPSWLQFSNSVGRDAGFTIAICGSRSLASAFVHSSHQIGDRNRNYSVRLACVAVDPANEEAAVDLLKKAVPRRKRVNLRPEGNEDGVLIARVTPLDADQDLGLSLVTNGLATQSCNAS